MNTTHGQRQRILERLLQGGRVPMPELHRIGSGRPDGFCASLTRRLSEIRSQGYAVTCYKQVVDGQTRTEYELSQQSPPY